MVESNNNRSNFGFQTLVRLVMNARRYASHLVSNGVSFQIVGKLLGHTQPQTTARYAHLSDGALRDATNRFGEIFKATGEKKS
jgi:integrase